MLGLTPCCSLSSLSPFGLYVALLYLVPLWLVLTHMYLLLLFVCVCAMCGHMCVRVQGLLLVWRLFCV